jgi:hypothetical protein
LAVFAFAWAAEAPAWEARQLDDGALFYGIAQAPEGLTLLCIGPSRRGISPMEVDAHETAQTPPYAFRIEMPYGWLPEVPLPAARRDVVIWADETGYRLPLTQFNEMDSYWMADVAMSDPLIGALRGAARVGVGPETGPVRYVSGAGLGRALEQAMTFCIAEYQRMGLPVPAALAEFASRGQPGASGTVARAEAAILARCQAPAERTAQAILTGDMDGDGVADAILDWNEVTCRGAMARPFCGAAVCSIDFFLSGRMGATGPTKTVLGGAPRMVPLSNGTMGLRTATAPASCNQGVCWSIWYWNGRAIETLN